MRAPKREPFVWSAVRRGEARPDERRLGMVRHGREERKSMVGGEVSRGLVWPGEVRRGERW